MSALRSRASIQNDINRIRLDINAITDRRALADLIDRHDFKALPEAAKKDLQEAVNARWKVVQ